MYLNLTAFAVVVLVIAINIHFPFFIAAGAIVAGMAILSTARSLLTEAERVQAEQVSAATSPSGPARSWSAPRPTAGCPR